MEKLLWPAINLLGLLGFIFYKTKTPVIDFVRGRRTQIFNGLNQSRVQAQDAAQRRAEIEKKLATLDAQKQAILKEWQDKAQAQNRILQESSVRIMAQMRVEAEQNKKALVESTRKTIETGFRKNVMAQAEEKILKSLNAETHAKINARLSAQVSEGMGA